MTCGAWDIVGPIAVGFLALVVVVVAILAWLVREVGKDDPVIDEEPEEVPVSSHAEPNWDQWQP